MRVCSRGMRWRWLLLWLLELECRLRRLCFRRCESSRERLCVLRSFFLWDGLRSLWLLWQDALSSSMSLALFCGCDSASLGKLWISSVGLPKDRCCLARSSGGSGVMLCRVVRRVGVLGSCASSGSPLRGLCGRRVTRKVVHGHEVCWREVSIVNHLAGEAPPVGRSMPM